MYRVPGGYPGGYPGGSPQFAFSRKTPHTAPPKKLASSSARPAAALRDVRGGRAGRDAEALAALVEVDEPSRVDLHLSQAESLKDEVLRVRDLRSYHEAR